jgi:hypothetical protein
MSSAEKRFYACLRLPLTHPIARRGLSLIIFGATMAIVEFCIFGLFDAHGMLADWILGNAVMHVVLISCGVCLWIISNYGGIEAHVEGFYFWLMYLPISVIVGLWVWGILLLTEQKNWQHRNDMVPQFLLCYETFFNGILLGLYFLLLVCKRIFPSFDEDDISLLSHFFEEDKPRGSYGTLES